MVKFADGGNKKKSQYNSLPWLTAQDADVSDLMVFRLYNEFFKQF